MSAPGITAEQRIVAANCLGTLAIDGESMNRDAWAVINVMELWQPPKKRGDNLLIPGRTGLLPFRQRITETSFDLQLVVIGGVDRFGFVNEDPVIGLEENLAWLDENVFTPPLTVTGTREAILEMPSGEQRVADVQIGDVTFGVQMAVAILATVEFRIPGGRLVPVGS